MTANEALKIIGNYGGVIAAAGDAGDIHRLSSLPCSKAKIKQAFFTWLDAQYKETHSLPKYTTDQMVQCYAMLNSFVNDEKANRLQVIKTLIDNNALNTNKKKGKELTSEYLDYVQTLYDFTLLDEINEYINEIQKQTK